MPLEYMLDVMRDESQPDERRDKMALAAAPYLHAKLSAVELDSPHPEFDLADLTDEELERTLELRQELDSLFNGVDRDQRAVAHSGLNVDSTGKDEDDTRH